MNTFFIYDTVYCKADEDDPKDAVVYFFPMQATDSQRYFLCCQLVGVAKFLKSTFSTPSIIGLDHGKFAFLWSGNYLLVLGGNSDVSARILLDQLSFLSGMFCFYHGNFTSVLKECKNDRNEFLKRMETAWSRYIALSQCFGNVLQLRLNALSLNPYRKNNPVASAANRLLHMCQLSSSVLAGAVFHNTRVASTQFMPQLTNYLTLLSNENASAPVGDVPHLRNLPPDVDLKYVHLSAKSVSGIVKYQHTCVGSRIRVKTRTKAQLKLFDSHPSGFLSSGSEGDVDSGNCSESRRGHDVTAPLRAKRSGSLKVYRQKKLCTVTCCVGHSRLFERNLLSGRNQNVVRMAREAGHRSRSNSRRADRDDSGIHSNTEPSGTEQGPLLRMSNLLCASHAQQSATSFAKGGKMKHSNFTSACDAEFRCCLCTSYHGAVHFSALSLKRWNSDVSISRYSHHQCACGLLTSKPCEGHSYTRKLAESSARVQVLRCRPGHQDATKDQARTSSTKRVPPPKKQLPDVTSSAGRRTTQDFDDSGDRQGLWNIENNELQKHVIYVQRCGSNTLVLLLSKTYDGKVINYLWNCGFTVLRELESSSETEMRHSPLGAEPSFYILLYNHVQKRLKEFPNYPSVLLCDKNSREMIQRLYDDFHVNLHMQSMSLLSASHSIFASKKDHNFTFYLQPENNTRKLDPLGVIDKKAIRRLGKYFKVV